MNRIWKKMKKGKKFIWKNWLEKLRPLEVHQHYSRAAGRVPPRGSVTFFSRGCSPLVCSTIFGSRVCIRNGRFEYLEWRPNSWMHWLYFCSYLRFESLNRAPKLRFSVSNGKLQTWRWDDMNTHLRDYKDVWLLCAVVLLLFLFSKTCIPRVALWSR